MNSPDKMLASGGDLPGELPPDHARISRNLMQARHEAASLSGFPGTPPADLASAYRIQARSIDGWPDDIAGWKVGGIPPQLRAQLDADWLVGPIFAGQTQWARKAEVAAMPVFEQGFAAIEPEFVVMLGGSRDQDRLFIGAEIASSPVPAINDYGPTAVVCDFGNNNGLLIGEEIADWSHVSEPFDVTISIDGKQVGRKLLADGFANCIAARNFCIAHAERDGRTLKPGTLVSTGAITGVHEARAGARSSITFEPFGALELELIPATAMKTPTRSTKGNY